MRDHSSVTVVLPFRNAGSTIEAALAGLLAEADPTREVLAIDDGSTDGGRALVEAWARRDARVKLLDNSGHGLVAALNLGLERAQGALVARMDADDIAHPARLRRQRDYLCEHPSIAVLGCQVRAVGGNEGLRRYVDWQNALLTPAEHAAARFVESPLCHPSIMARRSVLLSLGGYRAFEGPEDYELFLRAIAHGHTLAKLPEVLLDWHHREGRATFSDARYSLARFRATKAPYLAEVLQGRCVALWGAGQAGRRLARELAGHGVRPALFIDLDPAKLGRSLHGVPVRSVESLDAEQHIVVVAVAARGARELIRPQLLERGFVEGESAWFAS